MTLEDNGQGTPIPQGEGTGEQINVNPAWNDALSGIPEEYHSHLHQTFSTWDKGVQDKISKVHSQYEGYRPFLDAGIQPEEMNFAVGILNAINSNPQQVVEALNEWLAQESGGNPPSNEQQGLGSQPQATEFDLSQHPEYKKMNDMVNTMAQIFVTQREQEEQREDDEALEQELSAAREKLGDFDEEYVIGRLIAAGGRESVEDAVQAYQQLVEGAIQNHRRPNAPPVLSGGGSFPNSNVKPRELDSSQTKNLVAQMLAAAQQQQ